MEKKSSSLLAAALLSGKKPAAQGNSLGLLAGVKQGPFAPMGAGTNIGTPIDMARTKIPNAGGSFSTERTITIPFNGRWYNVPTIIDGHEYGPQEVEQYFNMGLIPHVGEYLTVDQAERSARVRSDTIGKVRK